MRINLHILSLLLLSLSVSSCKISSSSSSQAEVNEKPAIDVSPSPAYLTPKESLKSIYLPKGYHLELVASEPMIQEPVTFVWDGNGVMYVAEFNTYMQNIDGTGKNDRVCKIKRLEDTNGDGIMDKSTIFIDSLVMPRMLLTVGHELLVNETNNYNVFAYKDTNGDGKADVKRQVYHNNKIDTRNLEHQNSGLLWNLDNRIYVTRDANRFRYINGQLVAEALANPSMGQWGIGNDDYGRLYFSAAGATIPALGFQINPVYGELDPAGQYPKEFNEVWPIIATPDAKSIPRHSRPDSTLNHFTASCGQSIFRGDRLPANMKGDLFICEPAGRLIRRAKVTNQDGKITLKNAYNSKEFIASTDMNFRPVFTITGPDGCLYIVDMNRGIIQEREWVEPGSLIRSAILNRGLEKNIGHGRIYRLVHDGYKPGKQQPKMLNESTAKLVSYLAHPNGWWRDNAQKELVLRGDKSVVTTLKEIASGKRASLKTKPDALARIHALWTLDGLQSMDKDMLFTAFNDPDAQVRKTAVWISEPYLEKNDEQVLDKLSALKQDLSADVQIQLLLSLSCSKSDKAKALAKEIVLQSPQNEMLSSIPKSLKINEDTKRFGSTLAKIPEADRNLILKGEIIYKQLCSSCHGAEGKGLAIDGGTMAAPPFVGSKQVSGDKAALIKILLNGLSGPIDGKTYSELMPPFGAGNNDEWVASALSYVRHNFGKQQKRFAPVVSVEDVKKIRTSVSNRANPWTIAELEEARDMP
jgi:glucose/arabinose dehydrogenase/mono/diheme cytochrome c family protein